MKCLLVFLVYVCFAFGASSQGYDLQWACGDVVSVLDFRADTIVLHSLHGNVFTITTVASICDELGNLLFISNGRAIYDGNGDSLSNGSVYNPTGYNTIDQGVLFLPRPGNSEQYLLFHYAYDTLNNTRPSKLLYTILDKNGNFGQGTVIQKNIPALENVVLSGCRMTACRHANGRDWWLIVHGHNNNAYYKFLVTPDSVLGPFKQIIGPVFRLDEVGQSKFSEDGNKFASGSGQSYIVVMDFDRCLGEFSNPINIYNNASADPQHVAVTGGWPCFSPSGRFLYVNNPIELNQYDLWTGNPQQDSVSVFIDTSWVNMELSDIAPNGKIYLSCYNGGVYNIHVINYPDSAGLACSFQYLGQPTLSVNSANLPNLVNYRLGPLAGSGCDTIISGTQDLRTKSQEPRIQPNPADKFLYVEMPQQGNYNFELLNESGQLIEQKQTRQVDVFNTEKLPGGIYFIKVSNGVGGIISTQRIVVRH